MNTFIVNGTEYKAKPFDFNLVCDLEDMGVPLAKIEEKPMSAVRAYFSLCAEEKEESAGKEIEAHVIAGGKFSGIMDAMLKEMDKSDFFQSLTKTAEKKTAKNQEKEKNNEEE